MNASSIFPDLNPRECLRTYQRWQRLQGEFVRLQEALEGVTDEGTIEQITAQLALLRAKMAELSPPSRWLWHDAKPVVDRFAIMAELKQR